MTLTQTLAWRRSGVVSTSVIVANPTRGSATSRATIAADLLPQQLVDPICSSGSPAAAQLAEARLTVCEVKHSMMSPSTMSWKFARPMPHS